MTNIKYADDAPLSDGERVSDPRIIPRQSKRTSDNETSQSLSDEAHTVYCTDDQTASETEKTVNSSDSETSDSEVTCDGRSDDGNANLSLVWQLWLGNLLNVGHIRRQIAEGFVLKTRPRPTLHGHFGFYSVVGGRYIAPLTTI